jgi:DNA polymerase-3 subunit alpha (Gram-positive type)
MQKELEAFLRYIELDVNYFAYYENAEIESVRVINEVITINMILEKALETKLIHTLFSKLNEQKVKYRINFSYKNKKSINEIVVNAYYSFIMDFYYSNLPIKEPLSGMKLRLEDDKIIVPLVSKSQYELFNDYITSFQDHFTQLGVSYELEPILDETSILEGINLIKNEEEMVKRAALEEIRQQEELLKQKKQDFNPFAEHPLGKDAMKVTVSTIQDNDQRVYFLAKIFSKEEFKRRNGSPIYTYMVTDDHDSLTVKCREQRMFKLEQFENLQVNGWYYFMGSMEYDAFAKENLFNAIAVAEGSGPDPVKDTAPVKRVELHLHTKMSTMDGVTSMTDYVNQALSWGHKAIAVTDHASVQAFPELQKACKGKPIKPIYGLEAYMIDDSVNATINSDDTPLDGATFVHFDLETTGLSAKYDRIIEFGAVKVINGTEVERLQTFINPKIEISDFTTSLTGITNNDVRNAPTINVALAKITKFIDGCILVAHNAQFDYEFLNQAMIANKYGPLKNPVLDTLPLARLVYPHLKSFSLGSVANNLSIPYDEMSAHRADYDAFVLKQVFDYIYTKIVGEHNVKVISDLDKLKNPNFMKTSRPSHVTMLVKNNAGLKSLYQLVSASNVDYLGEYPLLPRSLIEQNRKDLLVGSACFNGEIFDIASTRVEKTLMKVMNFYDYIEVQPIDNYSFLVQTKRVADNQVIERIIKDIISAAKKSNKLIVATSDCHYLEPNLKIVRDIYISSLSVGNRAHPLFDYRGRVKENPNQHFRSTTQMLEEMSFLGEELANEIVVTNTNLIADMISDDIFPVKDQLFYPVIDNCEEELQAMCYNKAKSLYGDPLPIIVLSRIQKEIKSILDNKFSVIYYIAHKLVKMSLEAGYLVGSRGSVGSSFVATLMDITEVNPLPPHYLCPNCKHSEFFEDGSVASGFDLDDKECPHCGAMMKGQGQNIQFETFLGFKGDKVPDIDLNFSSEFQATAHNYTKVLLGEKNVLRAGTISTVAEKTAFGYVLGYYEKHPELKAPRKAEKLRLASLCKDVKRTTGQHPGGIIVIPKYLDIYDITPVQYPADEVNSAWKTTHFDYHAIHDEVLKLDMLGHVDPSAIRMLQDITKVDPLSIPFNDKKVLSLFSSKEALNIKSSSLDYENGAAGIPEFGTSFVRKMLDDTKPKLFSELVQISGLSHGTDVWFDNAQTLILNNICTLMEVIGCRDDIMLYLIQKGLPASDSFKIMEDVRKGKKLKPEYMELMLKHDVPQWYIDSCNKIQYMFPKAHAVAYVMMAYRVAWFKIYYPLEYYACYFTLRCDAYEITTMIKGRTDIADRLDQIRKLLLDKNLLLENKENENKLRKLEPVLEVALEMTERGYSFAPINLYKSQAKAFVVDNENKCLIPPFITLDGLGEAAAESIIKAREENQFISKNDLLKRTSISTSILQVLDKMGVTSSLPDENQLQFSLF